MSIKDFQNGFIAGASGYLLSDNKGGGVEPPEEAFKIIEAGTNRFYGGHWDWFIEQYGDKITTSSLRFAENMFYDSKVETIPFDININHTGENHVFKNMFFGCSNLKQLPAIKANGKIGAPSSKYGFPKFEDMFYSLYRVREIPYDYITSLLSDECLEARKTLSVSGEVNTCQMCKSLRNTIDITPFMNYSTAYYDSCYTRLYTGCHCLDEITNLPVETPTYKNDVLGSAFLSNYRLKNLTFAKQEDNTPYTANWGQQVIDLTHAGYSDNTDSILGYNSGITADKEVVDDATYQSLAAKFDPDWFSCDAAYSRYNRTSAITTIDSLPDTSAYLAANGGTNTIKFKGAAGSKTGGGAINTLSDTQIAKAAAKGWTVAFV